MIEYRWIDGEELNQLEPILSSRGLPSLNPNVSRAIAAYEDDKLIGFLVLQLFPHMEPIYVDREHRGTEIANEMVDRMFAFVSDCKIRGFMSIAESQVVEKMCKERGMDKIESPVYLMR